MIFKSDAWDGPEFADEWREMDAEIDIGWKILEHLIEKQTKESMGGYSKKKLPSIMKVRVGGEN